MNRSEPVSAMPSRPPASLAGRAILLLSGLLVIASFWTLDLQWAAFLEPGAFSKMAEFIGGFFPPTTDPKFLRKMAWASLETVAMSALGTVIAAAFALALAWLAAGSASHRPMRDLLKRLVRVFLNVLRSIPELVWAALLVISAGLGPFPGTLALAAHTTGVLGRLFADSLENLPPEPAEALRQNGAGPFSVFAYATVPLALPQLLSYTLYRWENNIRAATVLGVVGAGGLGQLLYYHLSLFQMQEAASVVLAMLVLVGLVDALSFWARQALTR